MNRHRTPATLAALVALVAVPAASATEIYKWTDENGVVHFGDRPSGVAAEQVTSIESDPTDAAQVQARVEARKASQAAEAEDAAAAGQQELTEEELEARERERAERCAMLKERLQAFLTSRRLYREGENGERIYLNEEETLAARAKLQKEIVETCE